MVRHVPILPGQYFDKETYLNYNWNRYYDPFTGRYISADPIGLAGGMNLYRYANANPINWFDPDGLDPDWKKIAEGGTVEGHKTKLQKGIEKIDNCLRNKLLKSAGLPVPVMLTKFGPVKGGVAGAVIYVLRPKELGKATLDDIGDCDRDGVPDECN